MQKKLGHQYHGLNSWRSVLKYIVVPLCQQVYCTGQYFVGFLNLDPVVWMCVDLYIRLCTLFFACFEQILKNPFLVGVYVFKQNYWPNFKLLISAVPAEQCFFFS